MTKIIQLEGQSGRLDQVLTNLSPGESRSTIQKWIKDGLVTVDDKLQKSNFVLSGNEVIKIEPVEVEELDVVAEDIPLDIYYEDEYLLVVNKPAGMVMHPSKGHSTGTLVNALLGHLGKNISNTDTIRPGIVHRLDKDTSGLVVVAKNNQVHTALAEAISNNEVVRKYQALVHGSLSTTSGRIEMPLKRSASNRLRWEVDLSGKYALTEFELIERSKDVSLVELNLLTGRTHQIRVHLEAINHPVVGDPVYRKGLDQFKSRLVGDRSGQLLHAKKLEFIHPVTKEELKFESPLPERFNEIYQKYFK